MISEADVVKQWRELGKADPKRLAEARLNFHWASQIVSAVGNTLLPPKPDDSHTNLEWLASHGVLAGNSIDWNRPFRASIRPYDLMLQLRDGNSELISEETLQEKSYDEGIRWLTSAINAVSGREISSELKRGDYDMPSHEIEGGGRFSVDVFLLKELGLWFSNADMMMRFLAEQHDRTSPVRCWPHHFDIGMIIELDDNKSIGIGMAPGDEFYDQPYCYVRAYPTPENFELPDLKGGGFWRTEGWHAALLLGTELVKVSSGDAQGATLLEFLRSAIAACEGLLSAEPK